MASKDDAILSEAKEAYRLGIDAERDNRDTYVEDYRFSRLNEQWPDDILKKRQKEGRPTLTIPRLASFIRQVTNDARQNRPRIVIKPVDGFADPKTAQVMGGVVKNIEYRSSADIAYDTAVDCAVSGGFGYFRINVDYGDSMAMEKELRIERISNPLSVVGDPYSEAADSSDWNSAFITTLLSKDEFSKRYKDAAPSTWFETDYRGLEQPWQEGDEIMLAEWWTREEVSKTLLRLSDGRVVYEDIFKEKAEMFKAMGVTVQADRKTKGYKVTQRLLTGAEVIETVEWAGCYIPIVPVYGEELNIEGKRYFKSLIASAKDAQRRLNYWVSAATELVALAPRVPFIGEEGAFDVDPRWESANTTSHSYLMYKKGSQPPARQPLDGGQAIGAMSEAMAATDDIKAIIGMYDASLGQKSNETSGKAIMARQREGDTATFHFIDNLSRAIQHAGRIIVDLIPSVYQAGQIVRIMGVDGREATAQLGNRQPGEAPPPISPLDPEDLQQEHNGIDPIYDFGLGRYDVAVDTGPSFTTQREETAAQLTELIRSAPDIFPVVGDLLVKNMNLAESEEIARRLKSMMPQPAQGGPSPEMEQAQMAMEEMQGQMQQLASENEQLKQRAEIDNRKMDVDAKKAEIDLLKAIAPLLDPVAANIVARKAAAEILNSPDILQLPVPQPMPQPDPSMGQGQQPQMPQGGFNA
jgi:hypothetical protein